MERHVTVRHADRQRMQNSEIRIHKVGSMMRKIHGDDARALEPEIATVRHVAEKGRLREKVYDDDTP